jgi:hypothetical protein
MLQVALIDLTNPGEIVLDPFLGSGSTLIAAENSPPTVTPITVVAVLIFTRLSWDTTLAWIHKLSQAAVAATR